MKWLRCLLTLTLMVIGVQLVTANSGYAASDYDDYLHKTDSLVLRYQDCPALDITYTWDQYLGTSVSSFGSISSNGAWGVGERPHFDDFNNQNMVVVYWSENTGLTANWTQYPTWVTTSASHVVYIKMTKQSGDCIIVQSYDSGVIEISQEGTAARNLFFNGNPNYPSGYEGDPISETPPPAKYVAMGDSFSSGEGNPAYETGTNITGVNECHRSQQAWPRKLEFDSSLNLGSTRFTACSGSVSDYIIDSFNTPNSEPPQATYITTNTKLVTISIGGNDIGFPSVMSTCTMAADVDPSTSTVERQQIEHDECLDALQDADDTAKSSALQDKLEGVFSDIRSLGSSNLQVVVAGYPNLFPNYGDIVGSCVWGDGVPYTSGRAVASDEAQSARLVHDDLNATIQAAVDATGDSNIHFVNPTATFAGHELCRPDPWLNNVTIDFNNSGLTSGTYHPNADGQSAYATAVGAEVQALLP